MKKDLETRWHTEYNPLFFLAFAFHPSFRKMAVDIVAHSEKEDGSWGRDKNALTVVRLAKAATFYYAKHKLFVESSKEKQDKELGLLDKAVHQWLQGKVDGLSVYNEGENAAEWWNENRTENPEIAQLATFLLDCPVQGAACERLFKDFALFHTKQRNRLKSETVYTSTLVKHRLQCKYPDDKARCQSTKHMNRIVSADQYPRKNVPLSVAGEQVQIRRGGGDDIDIDMEEDDDDEEDNPSLVDILAARPGPHHHHHSR
jgi:hAT family C-terminal dimerisation region